VLLVGDAAGLVDPLSGEGIRHAVHSGRIAAEAILSGRISHYDAKIYRQIGAGHRATRVVSQIIYRHPRASFALAVRNPFARPAFVDFLSERSSPARFALRLLGDMVECGFTIAPGTSVTLGQEIGSVEGFKAATSICSVVDGEFVESSEELGEDVGLAELDPYGRGWLYRVRGRPDPESVDVSGYVSILDASIDAMLRRR